MNTSSDDLDAPKPPEPAASVVLPEPVAAIAAEARFGAAFLRRHGARLGLVFAGVLLPLWGFGALVLQLRSGSVFFFDQPLLEFAHSLARDGLDRAFLLFSALGYAWGVIPADILLVVALALRRRLQACWFALLALGGAAGLNMLAKRTFARDRPQLWDSIAPEHTFSFPSAHAMGSMALACVCVLLAWHTRGRWWVLAAAAVFVPMVGLSRVYLGVHYPSDILAGWAAALVWTVAVYGLLFRRGHQAFPGTGTQPIR